MKAYAISSFAHDSKHVEEGSIIDLNDGDYSNLRGLGRVRKATAEDEKKKPAEQPKK